MCKCRPLPGCRKLTIESVIRIALIWLQGGKVTAKEVCDYYREWYDLSPYHARRLREGIAKR